MAPIQPAPKPFMEELEPDIDEEEETEEEYIIPFPSFFHPNCRCVIAYHPPQHSAPKTQH